MKKTIILIFSLFLISCSSTNIEKEVIHDFMNSDYVHGWNPRIIFQNAIPKYKALERYDKAYFYRDLPLSVFDDPKRAEVRGGSPPFVWPIDSLEIIKIKNTIKNDTITYSWSNKDFKKNKYDFFIFEKLRNNNDYYKKYNGQRAFLLSKPIINSSKDFALICFSIAFSEYMYREGGTPNVILLQKEKDKWIIKYFYDWVYIIE